MHSWQALHQLSYVPTPKSPPETELNSVLPGSLFLLEQDLRTICLTSLGRRCLPRASQMNGFQVLMEESWGKAGNVHSGISL